MKKPTGYNYIRNHQHLTNEGLKAERELVTMHYEDNWQNLYCAAMNRQWDKHKEYIKIEHELNRKSESLRREAAARRLR
jgi:hypothetical protein